MALRLGGLCGIIPACIGRGAKRIKIATGEIHVSRTGQAELYKESGLDDVL